MQLGSPIGSLFILASITLTHERGHFLAARSLGMAIEEFSIGFGPRVTGFVRKSITKSSNEQNQKDENIEFSLCLLPLGRHVRFPENHNRTIVFQNDVKMEKHENELKLYDEERGVVVAEKDNVLSKTFSRKKEITAMSATSQSMEKMTKETYFHYSRGRNKHQNLHKNHQIQKLYIQQIPIYYKIVHGRKRH